MQDEPQYVKETLAWCNSMRKEQGKTRLRKLPKGKISDGFSCPCGAATELFIGRTHWQTRAQHERQAYDEVLNNKDQRLPEAVRKFVRYFDSYDLPQYVDTEA